MNFTLTKGNVDDRNPVPQILQELTEKIFGDRGYVSEELVGCGTNTDTISGG